MSEQQNVDFIKSLYAAFGRGDIQTLLNGLSENVEWTTAGPPADLPFAGARQGRQQVAQFFQVIDDHLSIENFQPFNFIAQGDHVVVQGRDSGKVKSNGRNFDSDWVHVFTVRNGVVVKFEEYFDTAKFLSAFKASRAASQ